MVKPQEMVYVGLIDVHGTCALNLAMHKDTKGRLAGHGTGEAKRYCFRRPNHS